MIFKKLTNKLSIFSHARILKLDAQNESFDSFKNF